MADLDGGDLDGGDLDGGDLDIVANNLDSPALLLENQQIIWVCII